MLGLLEWVLWGSCVSGTAHTAAGDMGVEHGDVSTQVVCLRRVSVIYSVSEEKPGTSYIDAPSFTYARWRNSSRVLLLTLHLTGLLCQHHAHHIDSR
jgi:hypothetical protein